MKKKEFLDKGDPFSRNDGKICEAGMLLFFFNPQKVCSIISILRFMIKP